MKARMVADVERFETMTPETLAFYLSRLDREIAQKQHLKAAAMKAQRRQRKRAKGGGR